jgi:hypothetical protein
VTSLRKSIKKGGEKLTDKIKEVSDVVTTNDYAALVTIKVPPQMDKLLFHLKEEDTNNILYKIQGAQDEDFAVAEELKGETALAKNGSTYEVVDEPWLYVRVLHKAAEAEAQGKSSCVVSGSS